MIGYGVVISEVAAFAGVPPQVSSPSVSMMTMYGRHCDRQQQVAPTQPAVAVHVVGFELQLCVPVPGFARNAFFSGSVPIGSKPCWPLAQIVVEPAPPVVSLFTKLCWPW